MKKILVIQLCRIGDILMTGPLLRGLRRAHPSAEISLMVMDTFAATPIGRHAGQQGRGLGAGAR